MINEVYNTLEESGLGHIRKQTSPPLTEVVSLVNQREYATAMMYLKKCLRINLLPAHLNYLYGYCMHN